jgi:hypothetical protein
LNRAGIIADFIDKLVLTNSAIMMPQIDSADSHPISKAFSSTKLQYSGAFADILNLQIGKSANQQVFAIFADGHKFSDSQIRKSASSRQFC